MDVLLRQLISSYIIISIHFEIQTNYNGGNLFVLLLTLFEVTYAFGHLFIACELGQRVHQTFIEHNNMINQLDWYLIPVDIQRMLPMLINFTQQSVAFECFGSTTMVRETFKVVRIKLIIHHNDGKLNR